MNLYVSRVEFNVNKIISAKFQFGVPLYRQEAMFKQYGIELSRQTMSRWMLTVSDKLRPLYQRMHDILLKQPTLWADETTLNVLDVDKSKCYMWVYGCGTDKPRPDKSPNIVLYDYQDGRGGVHPDAFLADYCGPLQVDGYQGYEQTRAQLAGCWAHARRKFIEAKTVQGKGKVGKADQALSFIQKLYGIEQRLKDDSPVQKQEKRDALSRPVMDKLKIWLDKSALQVNPQSLLGKAIHHTLKQWDKLQVYLHDGHVNIDNNRAERGPSNRSLLVAKLGYSQSHAAVHKPAPYSIAWLKPPKPTASCRWIISWLCSSNCH